MEIIRNNYETTQRNWYLSQRGTSQVRKDTTENIRNNNGVRVSDKSFFTTEYSETGKTYSIYSYNLLVAAIYHSNSENLDALSYKWWNYSQTTKKHINTALAILGYKERLCKKEIDEMISCGNCLPLTK